MGAGSVVAPVLTYLFHRLEARFDGRPTLLILDEAWKFLDHPLFAARIREWLKTLRKKNVAVIFATQSLADIADSGIAPAIIESCPQRILLPNDRAIEPQGARPISGSGSTTARSSWSAARRPSGIITSSRDAATACSSWASAPSRSRCAAPPIPPRRRASTRCWPSTARSDSPRGFLDDAGLDWAAALLAQFPDPQAPKE
jgi:hypothetical protein